MVVAHLRGILRTECVNARDTMAENMVLDALDAELSAGGRDLMSLVTASTIPVCDPAKRGEILESIGRANLRSAQLRRADIFDSSRQIGLQGFGLGQKLSLVKLFRLSKNRGMIQAIHAAAKDTHGSTI